MTEHSPAPGRGSGWSQGLGSRAKGRRAQRGLTLVEILVAIALLLFGLMGFTHSILRAVTTNESTRESALAGEGARQMLETLQGAEFRNTFFLYNAEPGDDPNGPGSAPGSGFAVEGLEPVDGDADGLVGEIFFPAADAAPGVLREDLANAALGMPRDLNTDGVIDVDNHTDDYRILPVIVRLTWQGTSGVTRVEFRTILGDYL